MPAPDQDMPGSNKRQATRVDLAAEDEEPGDELQRQIDALKESILAETTVIIQTKFGAATNALKAYVDQSNKRHDARHECPHRNHTNVSV